MSFGAFISLEGPDGSGKTSNVGFLAECLREWGFTVVTTREPGGSKLAEKLRDILLNDYMPSMSELLLFAAARADHIESVIKPAMYRGEVVVSDRFCDSTVAYQGWGRGLLPQVQELEKFVHNGFYPDHTLYFDLPFEMCLERLAQRTDKQDRIDQEAIAFKENVWKGYRAQYFANPNRMVKIDASWAPARVQGQLQNWVVNKFVPQYKHLQHYPR
jgi:dTMP kinase